MLENLFSQLNFLQKGLEGLWIRNQIVSNNIANVDSKEYKSRDINFEQVFKQYLDKKNINHRYGTEFEQPLDKILENSKYSIYKKEGLEVKANGNNVNMDKEMINLSKNTMKYDLALNALNFQLNLLKEVIDPVKR